jgi:hypothetical protein
MKRTMRPIPNPALPSTTPWFAQSKPDSAARPNGIVALRAKDWARFAR